MHSRRPLTTSSGRWSCTREDDEDRPELMLAAARARFEGEEWDTQELTAARDALLAKGDTRSSC